MPVRRKLVPTARPTVRTATAADADALALLAARDRARPPRGLVLVAEAGGELLAALSLDDGHAVADPRHLAGDLVWRLLEHGRRLRRTARDELAEHVRVWPTSSEAA